MKRNSSILGMITSTLASSPAVTSVEISDDSLSVRLSDVRYISVPILWYPRLSHAQAQDREKWESIGGGHGIHWPEIDEDISVENILLGQPSGECAHSFARWKGWYEAKVEERGRN